MERRRFTAEFKHEAVKLARQSSRIFDPTISGIPGPRGIGRRERLPMS